jgi:Ca2+-transporting ATPase
VQVFQSVGLGYGKPAEGLMNRRPRPVSEALLGRRLLAWLAVAGFVMGASTLGVMYWAQDIQGWETDVARTMGMVTFSISNVAFSFVTKDERRSAFSLDVLSDRPFLIATGVSIVTILAMSETRLLQRILGTTNLDTDQWLVCLIVGLLILVVGEIRKILFRTALDEVPATVTPTEPAAAPAA